MTRLRAAWARLLDTGTVALQRLFSAVRGPSVHLVITGPDALSVQAIAEGITQSSSTLKVHSGRAAETSHCYRRVVLSTSLEDLNDSSGVMATVGRFRRVVVLAVTADPRDMVCARDSRLPHQWLDGFDYRFHFGPHGTKSFTEPGVLPRYAGLDEWKAAPGATVVTVTREELSSDARAALARMVQSLPSELAVLAQKLGSLAVSFTRPPSWSDSKELTRRVIQQVGLAPELESRAVELGYPALRSITKSRAPKVQRGTIVAFHTPDEVYRAEAARLKKTLDALGLDYHFFEVTPEKNWVRTTLLKPGWILKARKELDGPLLYIDVDAFVHRDPWPYLSQYDADLAAVVYDNGELNSASILINDTPGARALLERWLELANNRRNQDTGDLTPTGDNGDQGVLRLAVLESEAQSESRIRFQRFPVNLTYIFDRGDVYYTVGPVIIEQLQVSRETTRHEKRLARRRKRLAELENSLQQPTNGS